MTNRFQNIIRSHQHIEAFCLMWYQCKTCGHLERIWNSRDGVTPFGIQCPSCSSQECTHVAFGSDQYEPQHTMNRYQKFWRDGTPDEAEAFMRRRFEMMREHGHEITPEREAALIAEAREGTGTEFRPGWPMLDVYMGEKP